MPFDSDVAILGTGVAALVAANHLLIQGKSVLLLNPDLDFYLENSELPLDPLIHKLPTPERLIQNLPDKALEILRPEFPGAIELWPTQQDEKGYHDSLAPHIRQRGRLWIANPEKQSLWSWEDLEALYVEASDAGLKPSILDGISATRRFPGVTSNSGNFKGLYLPKICDVDATRYKNGLLEFIRDRLTPENIICAVNSIDIMPGGIRFHSKGSQHNAKIDIGILVFWTPRLTAWVLNQAKKAEITPRLPKGVRVWEQWSLNSRDPIDPTTIGLFDHMAVWCDFEGQPRAHDYKMAVLRSGPLVPLNGITLPQGGLSWASADSIGALFDLCNGFLKWDRFSVRAMNPHAIFEWEDEKEFYLSEADPIVQIVPSCDGALVDAVRVARKACDRLITD